MILTHLWTTCLIGTILALQDAITLLFHSIAFTVGETLEVAQRAVTMFGFAVYNSIGKRYQTYVLKGSIHVYTKSRRGEVNNKVGIAFVEEPAVRVCAIGLLIEVRHFLDNIGISQLVTGLHCVERVVNT